MLLLYFFTNDYFINAFDLVTTNFAWTYMNVQFRTPPLYGWKRRKFEGTKTMFP